jgi:hypothetical protein
MFTPTTTKRLLGVAAAGLAFYGIALFAAVALSACGDGADDKTGGKRVVFQTRVELDPAEATGFTTPSGWHVTLSRAVVASGAFYYFDGAPPVVERESPLQNWQYAARFLGLGVARAHPGHYQPGNALGQMLAPYSEDLLAGPTALPDGDGVTGTYRSARFSFSAEAAGPVAAELAGHVAVVEGVATKTGEQDRPFRATADFAELSQSVAEGHVEGCEFVETRVEGDGRVVVQVRPSAWFTLVDFTKVDVATAPALTEFPPGSQPRIAFAQGLTQLSAYRFSYEAL